MAKNDHLIAQGWANFAPVSTVKKYFQKVGGHMHGPLFSPTGTVRFSYDDDGNLFSYQMLIGIRSSDEIGRFLLLNADGAPSMRTNSHMKDQRSAARDALRQRGVRWGLVPFSALRSVGIKPETVRLIDRTDDREESYTRVVKGETRTYYRHYLGELLFRVEDRYWLSGLDRNDDPRRRMYYLCELPRPATTVEDALNSLRPADLPFSSSRQGEWFFVPDGRRFPLRDLIKKVPITSDDPNTQIRSITQAPWDRRDRHIATDMLIRPDGVYVRRTVHDDEHTPCRLGSFWHRVQKNLAKQGVRYASAAGVQVD